MKIAVVGSGISGLVAAHLLQRRHELTLFEARDRLGGHTHTVDVEVGGVRRSVDTGFIVYNEKTYPNFVRLLDELGVETRATQMSFGVSCERSGLAWSSRGIPGVLAQPTNLLRPGFRRMLRDILRFNRDSGRLLEQGDEKTSLGDYVSGAGYSAEFVSHYLVPMGAAIWSTEPEAFLRFPAQSFVRFFSNHGLLETRPPLSWRTVSGGSSRYVERLAAPFRDRIRLGCPVREIRRDASGVSLASDSGVEHYDEVVLAVHSDQALRVLADASPAERQILGSIGYQANQVVLHTDGTLLPVHRRARASWNYRIPREPGNAVLVSYDMNRLQGLPDTPRFLVTLNPAGRVDPSQVLAELRYDHPVFDAAALEARRLHSDISGLRHTHYCGAYWGNGFHEDGVSSAIAVCRRLGAEL